MKYPKFILLILLAFVLSACGGIRRNLQERAADAVAETITETVLEQATGAEIEIDTDGESVSYTVEDEDGNQVSISSEVETDIQAIEGMGFTIPVPSGLSSGYVQRMAVEGDGEMITASFEVVDTTAEAFFEELHAELVAAGFVYMDVFDTEKEAPDPTAENFLPFVNYEHPDGYNFSIIWGDDTAVLGLTKMEA
ncbi:MAG: hypothetical protein AAF902_18230 [Chloroflexota bacterium]